MVRRRWLRPWDYCSVLKTGALSGRGRPFVRPFGEASLPRENSAWKERRLIDLAELRSATLLPTKFRHKLARC